jgi:hypothetical protein
VAEPKATDPDLRIALADALLPSQMWATRNEKICPPCNVTLGRASDGHPSLRFTGRNEFWRRQSGGAILIPYGKQEIPCITVRRWRLSTEVAVHSILTVRVQVGLVSIAALLVLASCSSSSASMSVAGLTVAPQPHTSGPSACHSLASEPGLRQLPAALTGLYSAPKESEVHTAITNATNELNQLESQSPSLLSKSMAATVSALQPLLSVDPSAHSIRAAGAALENLAAKVQDTCHFSEP